MIIAFILFGVMFGAGASALTLIYGGSILLALAVYSGVGTATAMLAVMAALSVAAVRERRQSWADSLDEHGHAESVTT